VLLKSEKIRVQMAHGLAELIAGWNGKKKGHVFRWHRARRILEQFLEGSAGARRECVHAFKCTRKQSASHWELKCIPFLVHGLASYSEKNQERMDEKNKSQWLNKTKKRRFRAAYFLSNLDRPIKIQYLATLSVIYPHSLWITF
jgi:hypothetical protein